MAQRKVHPTNRAVGQGSAEMFPLSPPCCAGPCVLCRLHPPCPDPSRVPWPLSPAAPPFVPPAPQGATVQLRAGNQLQLLQTTQRRMHGNSEWPTCASNCKDQKCPRALHTHSRYGQHPSRSAGVPQKMGTEQGIPGGRGLASWWRGKHPEGLTGSLGGPDEHGLRSQIQRDAKCCSMNRKDAAQAPLDLLAALPHPKGAGPKSAAGTACLSTWHLHLPAAQMAQVKKHCLHSRSEGRKENRTATALAFLAKDLHLPCPSLSISPLLHQYLMTHRSRRMPLASSQ